MTHPTSIDDVLGDIFDTRDVVELVSYLETVADHDGNGYDEDDQIAAREEQERIAEFVSELEGFADYLHGETMIEDGYFEEYARQLADDIGAIDSDAGWPTSYIDWEAAADALKMDYVSVDFEGKTYWGRA